jgi:uncharacterized protein
MFRILTTITALFIFTAIAAQSNYKVVFDLTSKDSMAQKAVIRWVGEITNANPDAQVEIVMYGQGLALAVKGRSPVEEAVTRFAANPRVMFRVCSIALRNQHLDQSQLLPGVQTVPDGIYEIITKQRQGWGYIKAVE